MYFSYKAALDTYDPKTGYNEFGYDREGYDKNGYGVDGFDKYGFNVRGFDRNGKDRKGKGLLARTFAGRDYHAEIEKLNKDAIEKNISINATNVASDLKARADELDDLLARARADVASRATKAKEEAK